MPRDTVKVDRSTRWGNPYIGGPDDRACAVERFRRRLDASGFYVWKGRRNTVDDIRRELRGRNLACWCPPGAPCHADVLLEIANG